MFKENKKFQNFNQFYLFFLSFLNKFCCDKMFFIISFAIFPIFNIKSLQNHYYQHQISPSYIQNTVCFHHNFSHQVRIY